jgi:hypothetical protein
LVSSTIFNPRSGGELEDGTAAGVAKVEVASIAGRAIEVAFRVDDQLP